MRSTFIPGNDTPTAIPCAGMDIADVERVVAMREILGTSAGERQLAEIFRATNYQTALREYVDRHCTFDHGALLIFPERFEDALRSLPALGITPGDLLPSVVVRDRLGKRYGLDPKTLDVRFTTSGIDNAVSPGRRMEIFLLERAACIPGSVVEEERLLEMERHFALRLLRPERQVIERLRYMLREHAGFAWDGGGFNPHENAAEGGTSVLYFVRPAPLGSSIGPQQRLEVKFSGNYPDIIQHHLAGSAGGRDADGEAARESSFAARSAIGSDQEWPAYPVADSYDLQRAVLLALRNDGATLASGGRLRLSDDQRAALESADLRSLASYGVHPVLINAFARKAGIRRADYRNMLRGTGTGAVEGRPRWRAL